MVAFLRQIFSYLFLHHLRAKWWFLIVQICAVLHVMEGGGNYTIGNKVGWMEFGLRHITCESFCFTFGENKLAKQNFPDKQVQSLSP